MKNEIKYISEKEAQVTKAFMKKAVIFGTEEFKTWREYVREFPDARMVTKTIKKKSDKKVETKNMTYENMAMFIREQDNSTDVMAEFQKEIRMSKVKSNPYRAVLAWFMAKYSDVNAYKNFFAQRAAEDEEKENMFAILATSEN